MPARTLENSQIKKCNFQFLTGKSMTFLKHLALVTVTQDAVLGGQMHHALGTELCKMAVGR